MKTTQYILLDLIAGMDYDSIRVRTLAEREFVNGRLVSTTLWKTTTEQVHSSVRLNANVSAEYVLSGKEFQSYLQINNLFRIDVSLLNKRTA